MTVLWREHELYNFDYERAQIEVYTLMVKHAKKLKQHGFNNPGWYILPLYELGNPMPSKHLVNYIDKWLTKSYNINNIIHANISILMPRTFIDWHKDDSKAFRAGKRGIIVPINFPKGSKVLWDNGSELEYKQDKIYELNRAVLHSVVNPTSLPRVNISVYYSEEPIAKTSTNLTM